MSRFSCCADQTQSAEGTNSKSKWWVVSRLLLGGSSFMNMRNFSLFLKEKTALKKLKKIQGPKLIKVRNDLAFNAVREHGFF
jgi:hypothetical protein